jgi:hypothetical protein
LPQGALTEALGIALAGFRKRDDGCANAARIGSLQSGVARSEASAISKAILTDGFAVEIKTVEVDSTKIGS